MKNNRAALTDKELGAVELVLMDYNDRRLPRLLQMKERVDTGEKLDEYDIKFLNEVLEFSRGSDHFSELHPELRTLIDRVACLCQEITRETLENTGLSRNNHFIA